MLSSNCRCTNSRWSNREVYDTFQSPSRRHISTIYLCDNAGLALRQAINRREEELANVVVTDLDFADIALLPELFNQAKYLLTKVELLAGQIGLVMNTKKTKVMAFNHDEVKIITHDGVQLEVMQDFACNKLNKIWKSNLSREMKTSLLGSAGISATLSMVLKPGP